MTRLALGLFALWLLWRVLLGALLLGLLSELRFSLVLAAEGQLGCLEVYGQLSGALARCFPWQLYHFALRPDVGRFKLFHIFSNTCNFPFWNYIHTRGSEVVIHLAAIFIPPRVSTLEHIFMCSLDICNVVLQKRLVSRHGHPYWVVLLLLVWKTSSIRCGHCASEEMRDLQIRPLIFRSALWTP